MSSFDPRRVFHWGYVVPHMERAITTWLRSGAELVVKPSVDPIQNVECALLVYRDAVAIELVAPQPDGPNPVATRLKRGGGLDHVCFFTHAIEPDLAAMTADGGHIVVGPSYASVFDRQLAFVATRQGLTVELMTFTAVGRQLHDPLAAYFDAIG